MSSPAPPLAQGTNTKRSIGISALVWEVTAERLRRSRLAAGAVGLVSHAASATAAKTSSVTCFMGHPRYDKSRRQRELGTPPWWSGACTKFQAGGVGRNGSWILLRFRQRGDRGLVRNRDGLGPGSPHALGADWEWSGWAGTTLAMVASLRLGRALRRRCVDVPAACSICCERGS